MRMPLLARLAPAVMAAALTAPATAAEPQVVTSILPLQSLAANVMRGVATPDLLVDGAATPHSFQLRPSDAASLQNADLVIWVGEGLETFLEAPLASLPAKARVLELGEAPGISLLPIREDLMWHIEEEGHDHDDEHGHEGDGHEHDHAHGDYDAHLWLDAGNAMATVEAIAAELVEIDPANAEIYRANAADTVERLSALNADLLRRLEPLVGRPYVVFHDAYQYFEASYGLTPIAAITLSPERSPGAHHLAAIQERLAREGVVCVFSEPQFDLKLLQVVTEGTAAHGAPLDPLGADLEPGPEAYFTLMERMAASLESCLGQSG